MTFWAAALFQWVNVKGWVMAIGIITAYSAIASFPWNITIQAALMFVMGGWSSLVWAVFGSSLRQILTSRRGRQDLQYPDGPAAAGLALSSLHGRMMPKIA